MRNMIVFRAVSSPFVIFLCAFLSCISIVNAQETSVDIEELYRMDRNGDLSIKRFYAQGGTVLIDLSDLRHMNDYDRAEVIAAMLRSVCPYCSTTSTGSSVRVSYSSNGREDREVKKIETDDNYEARQIAEKCEDLVDRQGDNKDIHILDHLGKDTLAICFDDD